MCEPPVQEGLDEARSQTEPIDYAQGPQFDLGLVIEQDLQRAKQEQLELVASGVPRMDIVFLLLHMPDASTTPSAVEWFYSFDTLASTYTQQRWAPGWHKVHALDGRDHTRMRQVIDVLAIGKAGFEAHLLLPQLRAALRSWLH